MSTLAPLAGSQALLPDDLKPMPISTFKAKYGVVLKQADRQGVALISQGSKRYVIVSEDRMVALSANERSARSVADVCLSLPRPRKTVDMSAAQMAGASGDVEVPDRF